MTRNKKLRIFLILLVLSNAIIVGTGNTYLYRAVWYNFAGIDDNTIFEQRIIQNGSPAAWPLGKDYNRMSLPPVLKEELEKLESVAFLIIRNDSVRFEQYWDGYSDSLSSNSFSMAKTFVGILAGIAISEGKIKSIDEPVAHYLPEFSKNGKENITIRHLLTMSSGIDWDESYANPFSVTTKAYYGTDLRKLVREIKVVEAPGKIFRYLSGNTQILSFVLEKAIGKTLGQYASEKLWQPLEASYPASWSLDKKEGVEKAYCCFYSNARDFARFGQLYLDKGKWKGKQIVPEYYVNESIVPAPLLDENGKANQCYGYAWWILPAYKGHNIFYARGILGQYIIVIPEKRIIIVRLGKKRGEPTPDHHYTDLYKYIDGALQVCQ